MLPTWIVGSLWLSRARENAVLIARIGFVGRPSGQLGWLVPIVSCGSRSRSSMTAGDHLEFAAVGQRGRYRDTSLWWVLWIAYLLEQLADNLVFKGDSWAAMSTRAGPRPGDRGGDTWQPGLNRLGARGQVCPRPKPNGPGRLGLSARVERECALLDAMEVSWSVPTWRNDWIRRAAWPRVAASRGNRGGRWASGFNYVLDLPAKPATAAPSLIFTAAVPRQLRCRDQPIDLFHVTAA